MGKKKGNKYPEYITAALRQRLDLEADDTSRDMEINEYSSNEAFEELLAWEGIIDYAHHIKMWVKDIYGVDLNEAELPMQKEFICEDCVYHYKDNDDDYPTCHYPFDDGDAPCNWD